MLGPCWRGSREIHAGRGRGPCWRRSIGRYMLGGEGVGDWDAGEEGVGRSMLGREGVGEW